MALRLRNKVLVISAVTALAATTAISAVAWADSAGPAPRDDDSAADRYDWGEPIPEASDEFNYGSEDEPAVPDEEIWELAGGEVGGCMDGHDGFGQRCDENSRVVGEMLRQTGDANGDTGWLAAKYGQQYGRWEARVRSEPTGEDNGNNYHPLLILWPDSNEWPQDGEYDYLENMSPGEDCAGAFLHYPHDPEAEVQQEFAEQCDVDLTEWHNIAIEWTPDHLKGFVDGEEFYTFSGGENDVRECIQCAPSMHQTIQLDNFDGEDQQTANYEVDWLRTYEIEGVSQPG